MLVCRGRFARNFLGLANALFWLSENLVLPKKLWGIAGSDSRNNQIGKKTERQAKVVSWHVMLATIPISRYFLHQRHYQLGQVSLPLSLSRGESCLFSYINKFIKGSDHFNPLNFSLQPFKKCY